MSLVSPHILAKMARNAQVLGLTVVSQSQTAVVIDNGANDLTISYVDASIQSPMGGVSPAASPFLGIGIANPGQMKITSSVHAAGNMTDILDSAVAAQVFAMVASLANDIVLSNDDASFTATVRGHADLIGAGQ